MSSSSSTGVEQLDFRALRRSMVESFSLAELRLVCSDLDIEYENVPGDTRETKVNELIEYVRRRGRVQDLVAVVQEARPNLKLTYSAQMVTVDRGTSEEQRAGHRRALRDERRDIQLVHTVRPSPLHPQWYDILIYLVPHSKADLATVRGAEFFLGKYWGNRIFKADNQEGFVGISISAYGPVLCTCRILFQDGHDVLLDRYIDLEMAASRAVLTGRKK